MDRLLEDYNKIHAAKVELLFVAKNREKFATLSAPRCVSIAASNRRSFWRKLSL
jgi:hypothetical protein